MNAAKRYSSATLTPPYSAFPPLSSGRALESYPRPAERRWKLMETIDPRRNAKADLHVHSKHSNRPTEWLLRQFRAPESFSEPRDVYRRCRERGMDFVTLSDHDSIAGALEIAHLPGTFLSEEVTASFPEDGCQIHLLALGISEAQHGEIQRLRGNLYELRDYLAAEDVVCSVAHPLFR